MRLGIRQWVALVLLGVFVALVAALLPYFVRNLRFQRAVEEIARSPEITTLGPAHARAQVVEQAARLGLPVAVSDVQVEAAGGSVQISVRYVVEVAWPGYTVKLHFAPSGGR
ncbi:MAG: hypothetical protein HY238_20070 [Acidobacteria bacterium]|nr:hypothetical protein [Acidobacteriota bacterium]